MRGVSKLTAATAATPKTIACVSTCAPPISSMSSSGLAVHSSADRRWRPMSPRPSQCSSRPVPANAAALSSDNTNTVSRTEPAPIHPANACKPTASGPYTDGLFRQSCTARATGSPSLASAAGVVVYGSCPVMAIRP